MCVQVRDVSLVGRGECKRRVGPGMWAGCWCCDGYVDGKMDQRAKSGTARNGRQGRLVCDRRESRCDVQGGSCRRPNGVNLRAFARFRQALSIRGNLRGRIFPIVRPAIFFLLFDCLAFLGTRTNALTPAERTRAQQRRKDWRASGLTKACLHMTPLSPKDRDNSSNGSR